MKSNTLAAYNIRLLFRGNIFGNIKALYRFSNIFISGSVIAMKNITFPAMQIKTGHPD
ncbi:hypothetical protein [Thalassobacillus pellis]|uniref:hypothetical protein n=1 Tax=Thalassobacillus pellis TaxID=748008 RepID=UPI0019600907|nr:hypothetical protein [Thalassobacillus pellis]MBM7553006.1 hypothetical protein [Thalassobacillus pellis]